MMDSLLARGRRLAVARAEAVATALMLRLAGQLPSGIKVQRIASGIALTGKKLRRRFITDARFRGLFR